VVIGIDITSASRGIVPPPVDEDYPGETEPPGLCMSSRLAVNYDLCEQAPVQGAVPALESASRSGRWLEICQTLNKRRLHSEETKVNLRHSQEEHQNGCIGEQLKNFV
jgi:hypothetical protein